MTTAIGSAIRPQVEQRHHAKSAVLTPVADNKVLWFRKNVGITQAAGAVSEWADQSGNGNNFVQPTGAAQPGIQGDGSLLFDGVDDFLYVVGLSPYTPFTIYARLKLNVWRMHNVLIDGARHNEIGMRMEPVSPGIAGYFNPANLDLAIGVWGSFAGGRLYPGNPAGRFAQVSGFAEVTDANGASGVTTGMSCGASLNPLPANPARFASQNIMEIIVYNVAHTPEERAQNLAYLDAL